MTVISRRCDNHAATPDFPAAVGPQMTGIVLKDPGSGVLSATAEAALELIPGEIHDRRTTVSVVRRQLALAQRDEQRAHLVARETVAGFDGCFARHRRGEVLVSRSSGRRAISGQRRQRIAQTTLGVEAWMRMQH